MCAAFLELRVDFREKKQLDRCFVYTEVCVFVIGHSQSAGFSRHHHLKPADKLTQDIAWVSAWGGGENMRT